MKKYFKILVLILVVSTSQIKGVKAESFYEDNWISGVYANLVDGDFSKPQLMRFIRRRSDNQASYCLTPRVLLYENENYNISDLNLSVEQSKRIKKIAYYGYGYGNHTSDEWYAITQFMIWKIVEPNMDIFFTDSFKGNRIVRFTEEIEELERLVEQPDILPDIQTSNIELNSYYQLEDINNTLNEYKLTAPNNVEASIENNMLNIKSTMSGNYTLRFTKEYNLYNSESLYYSASKGQSILVPGNLKPLKYELNINVSKATIHLTKQDAYTGEVLPNATYGLFDSNYEFIKSLVTDSNGQATFDNLMPGTYYLLEFDAPSSYQVDNTYHDFIVDDAHEYIWLSDEKIHAYVYLHKYISNNYIMQPEKNILFEVYDLDDNFITDFMTDNSGLAITNLSYGKYKIHQVSSTEGYNKVNDYYLDINDSDDKIYYLTDTKIEEQSNNEDNISTHETQINEPTKEDNINTQEESNDDPQIDKQDDSLSIEENKKIKEDFKEEEKTTIEEVPSNEESTLKNPKTGDVRIYIYIIIGYISFILLLFLIACIKNNK